MKLFLHIGTEKTGTTTVQAYLDMNRAGLAARDIYVPVSMGRANHRWLPVLCYRPDFMDEFIREQQLGDPVQRQRTVTLKRAELKDELARVKQSRVVMTSEHLHSRLRSVDELRMLKSILAPYFDRIEILLYLRDPFSMAVSLYSTALRAGGTEADVFAPDSAYMTHAADYRKLIDMWGSVFGPDSLNVRLYETDFLVGGDVLSDFCSLLGLTLEELPVPDRRNASLSAYALQLLREVNLLDKAGALKEPQIRKLRPQLIKDLEDNFAALPGFRGSEAARTAYEAHYRDQVEWVRQTYFPQREKLFRTSQVRAAGSPWKDEAEVKCVARLILQQLSRQG